jgi:uncharacterized membrane protein
MFAMTISFANLFLASLVIGAMFGVWLFFNPRGVDAPRYVVMHQQGIRTMNTAMPALGAVTIVLTAVAAALARGDNERLALMVGATIAFVAVAAITRLVNQPINLVVMTWSTATPPHEWTHLRDTWWRWHVVRLVCGLGGLAGLILAELLRGTAS